MGDPKAFLTVPRKEAGYRPVYERIKDYSQVEQTLSSHDRRQQASRCMDCGVPFCHWACPLGNKPPEFQDALFRGKWREAYALLTETNDFPEFTGRVCPALCEKACVLRLTFDAPVTIRENELALAEAAFREGYVDPVHTPRTGRRVAVVGSGPAGLSAAARLHAAGHDVTVFERQARPGGLLRYGIPNFKLDKDIIDRRIRLMEASGITFRTGCEVVPESLPEEFDAYVFCTGTPTPRDLPLPGREAAGIHFALEQLSAQNRLLDGEAAPTEPAVSANGRRVLVIGGGDTGSDCVGTSIRQGALSVTQIEIMPQPPVGNNPQTPWPMWPAVLKTTSSHEEGCQRRWGLASRRFLVRDGRVRGVEVEEVTWDKSSADARPEMHSTGRMEVIEADLVLLAMGFLRPEGVPTGQGVFAAGDAVMGPSLVVRALADGRRVARDVDAYLGSLGTPADCDPADAADPPHPAHA